MSSRTLNGWILTSSSQLSTSKLHGSHLQKVGSLSLGISLTTIAFPCGSTLMARFSRKRRQQEQELSLLLRPLRAGTSVASYPLPWKRTDSYGAETYAALIAVKFAHDLLKLATHTGTRAPQAHLVYDNATVGMQSVGTWTCVQRPKLGHAVRHLVQMGEQRFHMEYSTHHVYGHQGDPGNEIVDTLARDAAEGRATHQLVDLLAHLTDSHFADNSAWFWLLFRPDLTRYWSQHCLFLPDKPSTVPSPDILNFLEDEVTAETPTLSLIQLKLATANVLSLKAGSKHADSEAWGPARQEALLRQFHDHGFHIFAMQETRLKKLWRLQDDRYIIIKSAATPKGHYGTALFFSRKNTPWRSSTTLRCNHTGLLQG